MKIVHVISDEKFLPTAHKDFETVFPGQNEFIVFTDAKKLRYIASMNPRVYKRYYLWFDFVIRMVVKGDVIVIHNMSDSHMRILNALPKDARTIWIGWGFDYYDLIGRPLLKEKTQEIYDRLKQNKLNTRRRLKRLVQTAFLGDINKRKIDRKIKIVNKATVFSPVLYEDYELVTKKFPNFQPKYLCWNYGNLEDNTIRGFDGSLVNGENILLGNSSTIENNHLDTFGYLKEIDLVGRKIVAPLSYGNLDYGEIVIKEGREQFGGMFIPLVDFIPIDEYINVLLSCSIVVMNHLRQQALGNVVIALYLGAKVFLDERNPIYEFFVKNGAYIYSLEQLGLEYKTRLTEEQVEKNRQVLYGQWGKEGALQKTKRLIETTLQL